MVTETELLEMDWKTILYCEHCNKPVHMHLAKGDGEVTSFSSKCPGDCGELEKDELVFKEDLDSGPTELEEGDDTGPEKITDEEFLDRLE